MTNGFHCFGGCGVVMMLMMKCGVLGIAASPAFLLGKPQKPVITMSPEPALKPLGSLIQLDFSEA
jgi:hypothetical protein